MLYFQTSLLNPVQVTPPKIQKLPSLSFQSDPSYIPGGLLYDDEIPCVPKIPSALSVLSPLIHVHSPACAKHTSHFMAQQKMKERQSTTVFIPTYIHKKMRRVILKKGFANFPAFISFYATNI